MKHEFTITKENGFCIELYTEDYPYGGENWIGEVWEDNDCVIHSCISPNGIDALQDCENYLKEKDSYNLPVEVIEEMYEENLNLYN